MLDIRSPKRSKKSQSDWEACFPYYAGYTELFARALLKSARLSKDALVVDPWNGSGTTTYAASFLGIKSCGMDINPVMVIVGRARLLPPSEADSIEPLAIEIIKSARTHTKSDLPEDALSTWFSGNTWASIRAIEQSVRHYLVGEMTFGPTKINIDNISGLAATFYVGLFTVCRHLTSSFLASNPTWLRRPKLGEPKIHLSSSEIEKRLLATLRDMASALANRRSFPFAEHAVAEVILADTTAGSLQEESIDFILTSPPYCTRIDYTAATRIELAVIDPLSPMPHQELSRQMIGSTRVPLQSIEVAQSWGPQCTIFLNNVRGHHSKASAGYYYKLYLDYFDKVERSLVHLASALKPGGSAVFVVQDSYYKDIHNDLPSIMTEMIEIQGLKMERRDDFPMNRLRINPRSRVYNYGSDRVEAVLCFTKTPDLRI